MEREIRDTIHGFIHRSEDEAKVIDSIVFQRLRNIKQLALASLVYPGATHNRFEHSIGVMHVAGKLCQKMIDNNYLDKECYPLVRFAALLHDIGHGPFSHVSEGILKKYFDKGTTLPQNLEKIHEIITCNIIENNKTLSDLISNEHRKKIVKIIRGDEDVNIVMKEIISGPLDADKQDYLLRDSYYCGVKYGVFDIDRLIHSIDFIEEKHEGYGAKVLAIPFEAIYTLEQFLIAKYHMSTQVYRHRIRLITDTMITRGIELGIELDNIDWLKTLYSYKESDAFINNYIEWDDSRLMNGMLYSNKQENYSYKIFKRLKERNLYKCIFSEDLMFFEDPEIRDRLSNIKDEQGVIKIIEEEIAKHLSEFFPFKIDKLEVILNQFSIKSLRNVYKDNEGNILITMQDKKSTFAEESALFTSINEKIGQQFLEIYAPVIFENEEEKHRKKASLRKSLIELITTIVKSNEAKK